MDIRFIVWAGYDLLDSQFSDQLLLPSISSDQINPVAIVTTRDLRPVVTVEPTLVSFPGPRNI